MASAQLYKSNSRRFSLKAHEFLNYYDPPARLFGEEGWSQQAEVGEDIRFGIKAVYQPLQDANENGNDRRPEAGVDLEEDPEDEDPQPQAPEDSLWLTLKYRAMLKCFFNYVQTGLPKTFAATGTCFCVSM